MQLTVLRNAKFTTDPNSGLKYKTPLVTVTSLNLLLIFRCLLYKRRVFYRDATTCATSVIFANSTKHKEKDLQNYQTTVGENLKSRKCSITPVPTYSLVNEQILHLFIQ